jgi:hypothetical protein
VRYRNGNDFLASANSKHAYVRVLVSAVHVLAICWNEGRVIDYFQRHHEPIDERILSCCLISLIQAARSVSQSYRLFQGAPGSRLENG